MCADTRLYLMKNNGNSGQMSCSYYLDGLETAIQPSSNHICLWYLPKLVTVRDMYILGCNKCSVSDHLHFLWPESDPCSHREFCS